MCARAQNQIDSQECQVKPEGQSHSRGAKRWLLHSAGADHRAKALWPVRLESAGRSGLVVAGSAILGLCGVASRVEAALPTQWHPSGQLVGRLAGRRRTPRPTNASQPVGQLHQPYSASERASDQASQPASQPESMLKMGNHMFLFCHTDWLCCLQCALPACRCYSWPALLANLKFVASKMMILD